MKTYQEINDKIRSGKALVLTAAEISDYVERHGAQKALAEVDVVTTATFGPMCSSGCFLNFGQCVPKIRITDCTIDGVMAYSGLAAVDAYLGATQLRVNAPANLVFPGDFSFGGGHVIEKLVAGEMVEVIATSYGTQEYPRRELRTEISIRDLNQAIMVNPRNCYQNYNVAVNRSRKRLYTYLGQLEPEMKNASYCSAGQLSPLLNDPWYETIGIGTAVWLAGARGHVHAEGTQHCPSCRRSDNGVPMEGAGTLGLTADMKQMRGKYVRGCSFRGYGASLALGIGIPIPILHEGILRQVCVRDRDILAPVIDYSEDYPMKTGNVLGYVTYEQLKSGQIELDGKKIETSSLSSYPLALEIAEMLKEEIRSGNFLLSEPLQRLPREQAMKPFPVREKSI
ncbi:MAG: homocysteine biosynthesis protein [Lentisphaeria bacterium]